MSTNQLIARWIEKDPSRPGPANARITDHGASVWALIGYLRAVGDDSSRVAHDYALPDEAIAAAIAYYKRNRAVIDARLTANATPLPDTTPAASS